MNNRENETTAQFTDLPHDVFTHAMPNALGIPMTTVIMGKLSDTCTYYNGLFQAPLGEVALVTLLQAVIDNDCPTIKRILESRPGLLLKLAPQNWVIESQLTWQKINVENESVLSIAAKRKQIEMIELMLPYYDRLPQTEAVLASKANALSAWQCYEIQKNAENKDEILTPREYDIYAQSLVDVFIRENFQNGNNNILNLSQDAESSIGYLFNEILLPKLIQLDNYVDVELLLLAVYKAYVANFYAFENWKQRDAFCIRIIGLIQSLLSPETAKIFCAGLDDVVTAMEQGKKIEISQEAQQHKLKSGESFYRSSRDSHLGLGFEFVCGIWAGFSARCFGMTGAAGSCLEKLCRAKQQFAEHYTALVQPSKQSTCRP